MRERKEKLDLKKLGHILNINLIEKRQQILLKKRRRIKNQKHNIYRESVHVNLSASK
jgi:hypothetical protein